MRWGVAEMRTIGQMSALSLPNVGYATNADHGAGCNIHPPPKQYCAKRLASSALALVYKREVMWKSPSFESQTAYASPPSVTVSFNDVSSGGLRDDQYPFNYSAAFGPYRHRAWVAGQGALREIGGIITAVP